MDREKFVYVLMDPRGNTPFYVGCTASPRARLNQHVNNKPTNNGVRERIEDIKRTSGLRPNFTALEDVTSLDAKQIEYEYIKAFEIAGFDLANLRRKKVQPSEARLHAIRHHDFGVWSLWVNTPRYCCGPDGKIASRMIGGR